MNTWGIREMKRILIIAMIIIVSIARPVLADDEIHRAGATKYCLRGVTATGRVNTDDTKFTCASKKEYFGKSLAIWIDTGDGKIHPENFIGIYEVTDTGSESIKNGSIIDIYEADLQAAKQFGYKKIIYQVIESEG